MPFYSFGFVMALACAAFFYKAGTEESVSGLLWGGLSLVVSALVLTLWSTGVVAVLVGQAGLLAAITLYRLWRDPD